MDFGRDWKFEVYYGFDDFCVVGFVFDCLEVFCLVFVGIEGFFDEVCFGLDVFVIDFIIEEGYIFDYVFVNEVIYFSFFFMR